MLIILLLLLLLLFLLILLYYMLYIFTECVILYDSILCIDLGTSIYTTKHKGKIMEKEFIKKWEKGKLVDTGVLYVRLEDLGRTHKVEIDIKKFTKYSIDNRINCTLYWSSKTNELLGSNIEAETTSTKVENDLYA